MTAKAVDWELAEIQSRFLLIITDPQFLHSAMGEQGNLGTQGSEMVRLLRAQHAESALQRFEIYRHGYFARLTECLSDDYPVLRQAFGVDAFEACCVDYIREYPSRSPNLNYFGRHFPEFLAQHAGMRGAFYSELARLEWTLVEVLHARAASPLTAEVLASVPASALAELRFRTNPSLRLLTFDYPVNAYFQSVCDERMTDIPEPGQSHLAVVRSDYTLWRLDLSGSQFSVLSQLAHAEPLGAALDGLEAPASELRAWFAEWTQCGIFSGLV